MPFFKKLAPNKRRTISFLAEDEQDRYFTTKANVHSRSLDGLEIASINVSSLIVIGTFVNLLASYSYDWLPCGEGMLPTFSWNDTKMGKGKELGYLCTGM